jgi:site-specific DNA recombinase
MIAGFFAFAYTFPKQSMFNEWFAKDTSCKVKAALHSKFANGERIFAYAPLGYKRDPDKKNALVIDEDTKWIIEKIFNMAFHGSGAASITHKLIKEQVPTPGWLNYSRYGTFANIYADAPPEKQYAWTIAQVKSILKDETYIGNTIHNRQMNLSYKRKKRVWKPVEEWVRVENTHETIVSKKVFEQVQQRIASRRRKMKDGTRQIFAGLVKCADCGWSMAYALKTQSKTPYGIYRCSKYGQCTPHYIRYDVLHTYVLAGARYWSKQAEIDEDALLQRLLKTGDRERLTATKKQATELSKAEKRKAEVDRLFTKMYEDWAAGRPTEYNFNMLSRECCGLLRFFCLLMTC